MAHWCSLYRIIYFRASMKNKAHQLISYHRWKNLWQSLLPMPATWSATKSLRERRSREKGGSWWKTHKLNYRPCPGGMPRGWARRNSCRSCALGRRRNLWSSPSPSASQAACCRLWMRFLRSVWRKIFRCPSLAGPCLILGQKPSASHGSERREYGCSKGPLLMNIYWEW